MRRVIFESIENGRLSRCEIALENDFLTWDELLDAFMTGARSMGYYVNRLEAEDAAGEF